MLDFVNPSHPSKFAVLRLVAEAQEGGGDVFDIGRVCKTLEPGDNVGWEKAWVELAERIEAKAKQELALISGRRCSSFSMQTNITECRRIPRGGSVRASQGAVFEMPGELSCGGEASYSAHRVYKLRCGDEEYEGYFCHPVRPGSGQMARRVPESGRRCGFRGTYFDGRPQTQRGMVTLSSIRLDVAPHLRERNSGAA